MSRFHLGALGYIYQFMYYRPVFQDMSLALNINIVPHSRDKILRDRKKVNNVLTITHDNVTPNKTIKLQNRKFIICAVHQIILRLSNQGKWNWQDV